MVEYMDILPNQMIRLAQFGAKKELMEAEAPWICVACRTCAVRCPKGISIAAVAEAIRELYIREGRDFLNPSRMDRGLLEELPVLAVVAAFRKLSA